MTAARKKRSKKKGPTKRRSRALSDEELEVMSMLGAATSDSWHQTRQYFAGDELWEAANSLVERGYAEVMDEGRDRSGEKRIVVRFTDSGITRWDTVDNPAKLRIVRPDELIVYVKTAGGIRPRSIRVAETVDGLIAVHPSLRNIHEIERGTRRRPTSWALTHVPTGQLIATVRTKDWAKRLAREIVAFSDESISSSDPYVVQRAIKGPGPHRVAYILHVQRQSQEGSKGRGKFPTFGAYKRTAGELEGNPQDLKSQAAVAAAVGSLVGGLLGAVAGGVILGVGGTLIGSVGGAGAAAAGAAVGAAFGVPLGGAVGTIWGAVRQTGRALEGYPARDAQILAGLGAAISGPLAPVGAGVGAYLGAPEK